MMQCLESSTVRARKRHVCTWCREAIVPGTEYHRSKWVDSRELWTQKAHGPCLDLLMRYAAYWAIEDGEHVDWAEVLRWAEEEAAEMTP